MEGDAWRVTDAVGDKEKDTDLEELTDLESEGVVVAEEVTEREGTGMFDSVAEGVMEKEAVELGVEDTEGVVVCVGVGDTVPPVVEAADEVYKRVVSVQRTKTLDETCLTYRQNLWLLNSMTLC